MRTYLALVGVAALAACGDPAANIQRLSEQDIPEQSATVEIAELSKPDAEGGGLFQRLLGQTANDTDTPQQDADAQNTDAQGVADVAEAEPGETLEGEAGKDVAFADPEATGQKRGLFALLSKAAGTDNDDTDDTVEAGVVQAALPADAAPSEGTPEAPPASPAAKPKSKGLFGTSAAKSKSRKAATSEITPGTVLPYGRVARICGLSKRDLGKQIAQHPEKRPVHRIYDSAPGNTAPHSFYVTGFDDGCARQFTASLAMFGSASMHEQLRYGLPADVQPYSDTDKAYEKVKSRVCGVSRKKPCGAKLSKLERSTVFVSIYERFGSNPHWTNLLLHDGEVVAQDSKSF